MRSITPTGSTEVEVSFIVPAFNEAELLPRTLRALQECRALLVPGSVEIIVCDNNSSDETGNIARELGVKVVFEEHNQIACARNRGAEVALGEWLIFVDADTIVSPRLFRAFLQLKDRPSLEAGGATLLSDGDRLDFSASLCLWNLISRLTLFPAGSFLFVRKAAFQKVGGFPRDFYAGEELGLISSMTKKGVPRSRNFSIIDSASAITSERKATLYSPFSYLCLIFKVLRTRGSSLKDVNSCQVWYDGRR